MKIGRFDTHNVTFQTTMMWWICFTLAASIGIWGFICPPKGQIDKSILEFIAWLFGFLTVAVAREAIKEGFGIRMTHGNTVFEVKDQDGPNDDQNEGTDRPRPRH